MKARVVARVVLCLACAGVGCNRDGIEVPDAGVPVADGAMGCVAGPLPDLSGPCAPAADLGPPLPDEGIAEACVRLAMARQAWEAHFSPPFVPHDLRSTAASCAGIAALPGSLVTAADIEACAATVVPGCGFINHFYPPCLGYGWNLLAGRLRGALAPGQPCHAHLQCGSGYCNSALLDRCGHCVTPRALGEPCAMYDECDPTTSRCEGGVCVRAGARAGDPCIDFTGHECDPDLYCSEAGTCARHRKLGEACDKPVACEGLLHCRAGICTERLAHGAPCPDPVLDRCVEACIDGVCRPAPRNVPECGDCSQGYCAPGLSCRQGTCVVDHWPGLGESCGDVCAGGLLCVPDSLEAPTGRYCVPSPAAGEPCTTWGGCGPGLECVGFNPTLRQRGSCVRPGAEGEPCPCEEEVHCVAGVCRAYDSATACR